LNDIYNHNKSTISQSSLIMRREGHNHPSLLGKNSQANKVKFTTVNSREYIRVAKTEKENMAKNPRKN